MTDGQWLIDLRHKESIYHEKRWNLRNKFKRYFRMNPYEKRAFEDELIDDLVELRQLRDEMKDISNNNNFKSENDYHYRASSDEYFNRAAKPIK